MTPLQTVLLYVLLVTELAMLAWVAYWLGDLHRPKRADPRR